MQNEILKALRKANARRSKHQLADATGRSYFRVSQAVNALVESGQIEVAGKVETGKRGRPTILYRLAS